MTFFFAGLRLALIRLLRQKAIAACLLLSLIFFDLEQWLPAARWLALILPPSLYLRAASGSSAALWQAALTAVISFLAGMALSWLKSLKRTPRQASGNTP